MTAPAFRGASELAGTTHLKRLRFSMEYVVASSGTKQFSRRRNHFPALAHHARNRPWLSTSQRRRRTPATEFGENFMRTLSLILAFGFVLAGSSFAGSPDGNVPGIGTFQYSGSPIMIPAPQPIVVAARF
jgi:hypothetical protein